MTQRSEELERPEYKANEERKTMKPIVMILLLVGCTFSVLADNGPAELKNLQAIRAKKTKEVDKAYIKALEKLKVKYTKRGDLKSANAVAVELAQYEKQPEQKVTKEKELLKEAEVKIKGRKYAQFRINSDVFQTGNVVPSGSCILTDIPNEFSSYNFVTYVKFYAYRNPPLKYEVKRDGLVLLVSDSNHETLLGDGWKIIGQASALFKEKKNEREIPLAIYQKELKKGSYELDIKGSFGTRVLWK